MPELKPISYTVNKLSASAARLYIIHSTSKDEIFLDLDDALYIEEELTPTHRNWREELRIYGSTSFDYHGCDHVLVKATEVSNAFLVIG